MQHQSYTTTPSDAAVDVPVYICSAVGHACAKDCTQSYLNGLVNMHLSTWYDIISYSVQAPPDGTRKALSKLFPSGTLRSQGSVRMFNPSTSFSSTTAPPSKRKRLSLERRKRIIAVLLPPLVAVIPRGTSRQQLSEGGRVKDIMIQRSWTELRCRQSISESFTAHLDADDPEGDIVYLTGNAGAGISNAPNLGGTSTDVGWTGQRLLALSGRENLYLKSRMEVREVRLILM